MARPRSTGDRITFDQLGLAPAPVEVFGRAEIGVSVDTRHLPPDTRIARLLLDIMVAPDGTGEKAVVSVFVNDRLLANAVAERDEPTHVDIPLPDGFIETAANIRAVVQRRSAQGDCRFEPQGYPAQILGSSAVILTSAGQVHDFGDLTARWANGIEVVAPSAAADRPDKYLGLMSDIVSDLSPELSPINVRFADNDTAATPAAPFLVVGAQPPSGSDPHVRFDRGRVVVNDRSGRTLLDLGGFSSGAVAQLVTSDGKPGVWVSPLASDGSLPAPALLAHRPRRCRLHRPQWRRARDVDRARHAAAHRLPRPDELDDGRRPLPLLDHRRALAARHPRLPLRLAAHAPAAAAAAEPKSRPCRFRLPIALSATCWLRAGSSPSRSSTKRWRSPNAGMSGSATPSSRANGWTRRPIIKASPIITNCRSSI